jgi:Type I phosphodiesterase / nucleotide pyrophosphatase
VSPDDPRVDDLRQQLKSLGYLDAGVDRFLLAPARGTRGPVALAARSSVRVGLLGGALLGPAAAVGLGARLPGLISGVRDAVVLALYLGVLFFLAVAAISFVVSLGTATLVRGRHDRFAKRARLASADAGWIISAACLVYLTFWWRNANAGFGWSAPVWTAFALAVAIGISWLLGHAVRITTLAVLAAGRGTAGQLPPVTGTPWRVLAGGGLLAFAGASVLLVLTAADSPSAMDHPPLTVVSQGVSLRLIAIDGFDPDIYESTRRRAPATPGVFGTRFRLAPQDTSDPARAWTTIAAGQPPEVHGVHGIETTRLAGIQGIVTAGNGALARAIRAATDVVRLTRPSIASRDERRSKTVWEVAEDAGLRTAVVNWWATWPAPPTGGIVITDRAVLRLEHGGPLDAEISPASLYPSLQQAWPGIRQRAAAAASAAFRDVPDAGSVAILRRSAELDGTILGIAQALPGPRRDLDVLYLPGLDIAQHALLAAPDGGAQAPSAVAARVDALRSYYVFLVQALSSIVVPGPKQIVMVVTQPGRVQSAVPGILGVAQEGLPADPGSDATARVVDLAPTVLYALGVPLSQELSGQPLRQLFGGAALNGSRERYVSTYGRPFTRPAAREGQPLDQEMIDRLRSLGYVK